MTSWTEFVRLCPKCGRIIGTSLQALYPNGKYNPEVFMCCGEIPPETPSTMTSSLELFEKQAKIQGVTKK